MKVVLSLIVITFLFSCISHATITQKDSQKKEVDVTEFSTIYNTDTPGPPFPVDSTAMARNHHVESLYDSSMIAYYNFSIVEFQRANKVLAWQYTSGKIIFWIVLTIVITGLILSGIQFYLSAKFNFDLPESEIELSYEGIRLHSSVLGLLILTISIAFFYMYLKYVYPISILK